MNEMANDSKALLKLYFVVVVYSVCILNYKRE